MTIKLTKSFIEADKKKADVTYLIRTIVRRHHIITFDPNITSFPLWIDDNDRMILEESYSASMIGDNQECHCKVIDGATEITSGKTFSISDAIDYANTPLTVIVENSNNDSNMILKVLDEYTTDTSNAYYNRLLDFDHAGGCGSVISVITEKLRQNGGRPEMLRYFVIVDGDRKYPTHVVIKHDKLKAFLSENNIPFHILEKRCMENYLPCEAFPNQRSNRDWLNAFKSLSPRQRDFMNIGGGFSGDLSSQNKAELSEDYSNIRELLNEEQRKFHDDVSDTNLRRLAKGYTTVGHFKEEFPKSFKNSTVTRESLDAIQSHQDNPDELKQLAQTIKKTL